MMHGTQKKKNLLQEDLRTKRFFRISLVQFVAVASLPYARTNVIRKIPDFVTAQ